MRENNYVQIRKLPVNEQQLNHIGKFLTRPDGVTKSLGKAVFTDDLQIKDQLYARVLRAGLPSAILRGLDTSEAEKLNGVVKVFTAKDLHHERFHGNSAGAVRPPRS